MGDSKMDSIYRKTFKKFIGFFGICAAALTLVLLCLHTDVQADSLPSLMNVEIVGDVIYWDAFDGAGQYAYSIKNGGGYIAPLVDEDGKVLKRQSFNLKKACEDFNYPGGTFNVRLWAYSDFGWKGGKVITGMWEGEYTNVTDKPQLAKPANVTLNDDLSLSWDPIPNAERYCIKARRMKASYELYAYGIETEFKYETTEPHVDLTECFIPGTNEYSIWIYAEADGYFDSEHVGKTYKPTDEYLNERLPDCYIKNLSVSSEGILSWDPYQDAKVYGIYVGKNSTLLKAEDLEKDAKTGKYVCDINYYCAAFGCEASDLEVGVSAFNDHTDNNGYRISGITRVTYEYGGIKTLTGEVVYSGEVRYGYTLGISVNGAPAGIALDYEWQVHEDGVWTKIASSSNSKSLLINADLIGKYIRVSVTAKSGYVGTVNGAPKQVGKAVPYKPVPTPELTYNRTTSGGKEIARIKVANYQSDCEYILTESTLTGEWREDAQKMPNGTYDAALGASAKIYYIYARYAETETRERGTQFVGSSIIIPAKSGSSTYANDLLYPEYDTKAPTIYLQKGQSITIKYQINPSDATDNLPRWDDNYGGLVSVSHKQSAKTITITASNIGTTFVTAYKPNENTPWYVGNDYSNMGRSIKVVVYDPNDPGKIPFTISKLPEVTLFIGDHYTVDLKELSNLPFVPDTVNKNKYQYSAFIKTKDNMTGMPYVGETAQDGSVTIKNAIATANKVGEATVFVFARTDGKTPTNADSYFAYFTIKVSQRPENKVEKLTLSNKNVSLRVGDVLTLVAIKDPIDAKESITWSSNNSSVVTIDANGKITAACKGKATVTAKCGTLTATCTVEVKPAYCAEHKDIEYIYVDQDTHKWTCKTCGVSGTEKHSTAGWNSNTAEHWRSCNVEGCFAIIEKTREAHTFDWVIDKEPTETEAGLKHEVCKICGCKHEAVEIPATGKDPSSATTDGQSEPPTTAAPDDSDASTNPAGSDKQTDTTPSDQTEEKQNSYAWLLWVALAFLLCGGGACAVILVRKKNR